MAQFARALRTGLALATLLLSAACGRSQSEEAEVSAAPVRHAVAALSQHPSWKKGKCLCVGLFAGDAVKDFPPALLAAEFRQHRWVRNWSACAPDYGRSKSLKLCPGGMADYICSTAEKPDLPSGTERVVCHVNGKFELLLDEYDVMRGAGGLEARPVSLKAFVQLTTIESGEEHF